MSAYGYVFGIVLMMSSCGSQPGTSTERVIIEGQRNVTDCHVNPDPEMRFPIPKEREIRKSRARPITQAPLRQINFQGDGSQVTMATDFPFQPLGMQWRGAPTISSNQLQTQRQQMISRQVNRAQSGTDSSVS